MDLREIYLKKTDEICGLSCPPVSFEVFPPKNEDITGLFEELRILKRYNPALVSLTYGASGTSSRFSPDILKSIIDLELNLMPHFTCVCSGRDEIEDYIRTIENLGMENILALRGDIPQGVNPCTLDFEHANELVDFIHQKTTLSIGVAGYPECHIEAKSIQEDIENLKRKVEAGASAIFTQLFFDNDKFCKYVELVRGAGIEVPIVAGIMPVRSLTQIEKMVQMTHVSIPETLKNRLEQNSIDAKKFGIEFAINQCQDLIDFGVDGIHFFTLNHSDQVSEILDNIL